IRSTSTRKASNPTPTPPPDASNSTNPPTTDKPRATAPHPPPVSSQTSLKPPVRSVPCVQACGKNGTVDSTSQPNDAVNLLGFLPAPCSSPEGGQSTCREGNPPPRWPRCGCVA